MEIQVVGIESQPKFSSAEELLAAAPSLGLTHTGFERQTHLLPVLQGLPKFKELAGPMGNGETADGEPRIRYETWEAYDLYSR
jgi:hypothetical protein